MKELSNKNKPQKLEDIFQTGMEGAEVTPSARVWERIEQGLDQKEAGYYKKRLSWYKALVAACIALVVCAAAYFVYDINNAHSPEPKIANRPQAQNNKIAANTITQEPELATGEAISTPGNTKKQLTGKVNTARNINYPKDNLAEEKENSKEYAATVVENLNTNQAKITSEESINLTDKAITTIAGAGTKEKANRTITIAVEPLVPVISWAGVTAKPLLPDTLPTPKALPTTPPALAFVPEPQADKNEKSRAGRWSIIAKYAPQYFNQNVALTNSKQYNLSSPTLVPATGLYTNIGTSSYTEALNEFDKNTASGYSYNAAVAAGYTINEHWLLETGLSYTQNVATTTTSYIFNTSNLTARYSNTNSYAYLDAIQNNKMAVVNLPATALLASLAGQQDLSNATVMQTPAFETKYRYQLLGIPIKLNYKLGHRKSFYFASVGFLTNLLMQAQVLSTSGRVPDFKYGSNAQSPFRNWQVAALISAGKGFQISKSVSFKAGLEGTQNLNTLAAHPQQLQYRQGKPYTIGLAFSSSYTLGL